MGTRAGLSHLVFLLALWYFRSRSSIDKTTSTDLQTCYVLATNLIKSVHQERIEFLLRT